MPYPESRLTEALSVIREDDRRRHAFEAEKLSRTQYRDKFHFRRSTASCAALVDTWQDDQPSDEDFDLGSKKRKRRLKRDKDHSAESPRKQKRAKKTRSEQVVVPTIESDQGLATSNHEQDFDGETPPTVERGSVPLFVTLKLPSDQGRHLLSSTSELVQQARKKSSQWELFSGSFQSADKPAPEQEKDFRNAIQRRAEVAQRAEDAEAHATVRPSSGKLVQKTPTSKGRKKDYNIRNIGEDTSNQRAHLLKNVDNQTQPQQALQMPQPSHRWTSISSSTRPIQPESHPPATAQPSILTLTTPFSHPIDFKSTTVTSCNFHRDYRFPLFAHGPITARYITDPERPGELTETGSGHRSHNVAADTMCVPCAFSYLQTIRCPRHTFSRIPDSPARLHALRDGGQHYVKDVFRDGKKANRNLKAPIEICNICPTPAVWRCCAVQERDRMLRPCCRPGEGVGEARARLSSISSLKTPDQDVQPTLWGCGLALCSACCALVANKCDGHLQGHRDVVLREIRGRKTIQGRADVEFLFEEGLLWKSYQVGRKICA